MSHSNYSEYILPLYQKEIDTFTAEGGELSIINTILGCIIFTSHANNRSADRDQEKLNNLI